MHRMSVRVYINIINVIFDKTKKMQRTSDLGCVTCIVCNWGNNSLLSWNSKYKTKIQSACIEGSPYTCSVSQFRSSIWNICLEKRDRISAILLIIYMRRRKQLIVLSFLQVKYINRTVLENHSLDCNFQIWAILWMIWCYNWKRPRNDILDSNWTKGLSSVFCPSCDVQVWNQPSKLKKVKKQLWYFEIY